MSEDIKKPFLKKESHSKVGLFSGYIFAINCTIGAGALSVPYAFYEGGWLFGLIFQIIIAVQGYYLSMGLLESMSRAEILQRKSETGQKVEALPLRKLFISPVVDQNLVQSEENIPVITHRMIACTDVARLSFGENFGRFFFLCLFLTKFGVMVSYGSIFAASFAADIPIGYLDTCDIYATSTFFNDCRFKYWFYLVIFCIATVYLTIRGIEEQQFIQLLAFLVRIVVMTLIIVTCIVAMMMDRNIESDKVDSIVTPPLFIPEKFNVAIPIICFALGYQAQIPTISKPVTNKARNLPIINSSTILTCTFFYDLISIFSTLAMHKVPGMVTLSYRHYSAGYEISDRPFWTYIIEYIIIVTPAIDALSGYPFQALTVADAVVSWEYRGVKNVPKRSLFLIRFFVAFTPIFISFFAYHLGEILKWVGLIKLIMIPCVFPAMHIALRHLVPGKSPYDVSIHIFFEWAIMITSACYFLFVVITGLL